MARQEPKSKHLRFLVVGAGAIGGYFGASLSLAGHPVDFLARGDTALRLETAGLSLRNGESFQTARPGVVRVEAAQMAGEYDCWILAVKSYQLSDALEPLLTSAASVPAVLCLLNGVEGEDWLSLRIGREKVIAGSVTTAVGRPDNASVVVERPRGVGLAGDHPLVDTLVAVFQVAGLHARRYFDPNNMKWSKLITNLPANSLAAILNLTPLEIYSRPDLFRLERFQLREALEVMQRMGLRVVDLPGARARLLAIAARSLPAGLSLPLLRRAIGTGRGTKMPSLHIDLYRGARYSEVSVLNGAVVRRAASLGIPTPVNSFLTDKLLAMVAGRVPVDTYSGHPEKLLAEFEAVDRNKR